MLVKLLDADAYTVTCAGQIVRGGTVCAVAVVEVYLVATS